MKKLEVILRPEKLELLKDLLNEKGITGMTVHNVMGCGNQKGKTQIYRGSELLISLLPKIKVEAVMEEDMVDDMIMNIRRILKTGKVGDGKIFISNIEQVVRIRTGERGKEAI